MTHRFYSNGKLLLTGEYLVLDGALSLALPSKYGQTLTIKELDYPEMKWASLDHKGEAWFHTSFDINLYKNGDFESNDNLENLKPTANEVLKMLHKILWEAKRLNPEFLMGSEGYEVQTDLSFPRDWGLGSSSTLINNIAQWAKVDPYVLLSKTFNGSGYDIACAQHNGPLTYRLEGIQPIVKRNDFDPPFKDSLFFVYLNKKQNSREGISRYQSLNFDKKALILKISKITRECISCVEIQKFKELMNRHELLLSEALNMTPVKKLLFPDFDGTVKSLGAWGGDFVLAIGDANTPDYFLRKGYETVIPYEQIIL
ncbi:GYDIA family GHMP kinase [uncultured Eudoraea sp.]|uniref:GYDIA family GHMP kinase n=1 Tax=uncultured Eudoraea sp. TaxID=1035614 RepID=UPI002603C584|nr:GYDIA family GHMP kinase [uncultured Eudoraea sp.]